MSNNPLEALRNIDAKYAELKPNFEAFITDKSKPLSERWEAFVLADDRIKGHDHYGPRFMSLPDDFVMYDGPIHMERGQTKNVVQMVQEVEEALEEIKNDTFWRSEWVKKALLEFNMEEFKEEVLKMNIITFNYDW